MDTTNKPRLHTLKTDPEVFQAVRDGRKTFEIRLNDRGFHVGDSLVLRETVHTGEEMREGAPLQYTGCELTKTVSHVLSGYGLADGWVCLSFATPSADQATQPAEAVARLTVKAADHAIWPGMNFIGLTDAGHALPAGDYSLYTHPAPASASEPLQAMADNERELGLDYGLGASASVAGAGEALSALQRFAELGADEETDPIERLRAFCSLAMKGQDWIDVEPFFDALAARPVADGEAELPPMPKPRYIAGQAGRNSVQWGTGYNCLDMRDYAIEAVRAALARQAPAPLSQAVPEGFWLAPDKADELMLSTADAARDGAEAWDRMRRDWVHRHPQNASANPPGGMAAAFFSTSQYGDEKRWEFKPPHNWQEMPCGSWLLGAQPQAVPEDARDGERLDWLDRETPDLMTVPTADDDFDWVVIQHHMSEPRTRELGRGKNPRDAIDAARAATSGSDHG